jgi:hypothetical protein
MVWSIGGIYVFLVLSLSIYPFQPRIYLNSFMFVLLIFVVAVVALMYAQMSRDPILSRVARTEPGKLGKEFYFKLAGFMAIPLLSLLSARYPAVSNMLFSWVQPAIESVSH